MKLLRSDWQAISGYLFIDRKLDSASELYLKSRFNNLCDYLLENKLSFNREAVNQYIQYKMESGCRHNYLNNIIKVIKYCHDYHMKYSSYDSGMSDYTYFKKQTQVFEIMTPEECLAIATLSYPYIRQSEQKNAIFKALYYTFTLTGMRRGEVVSMQWDDVTEDIIRINDTKTDVGRVIPNNPLLYGAIMAIKKYATNNYIFQGTDHGHMGNSTVQYDLHKRLKMLPQIKKKVWVHLFRHSFCVEMLRNNDVTIVAKIMGHTSLSSTLTYTHYLLDDMKTAVLTHPLLKEKQGMEVISKKMNELLRRLVNTKDYSISVAENSDKLTIAIEKNYIDEQLPSNHV